MKDTIVFCLNVNNEESYAEIANFIYKRETQIRMTEKDVDRVSYKYYLKNRNRVLAEWAQYIIRDTDTFLKINEPHKIKNITERYEVIYCICVDKTADVIDLYNLYLIKQHYSELKILALFPECDDSEYFSVSQFLYSVGIKNKKFYNECYFVNKGQLKRAQINSISFSRFFTPLQIVDKDNIERLFKKCKGLVTSDYLRSLTFTTELDSVKYDDLLEGAFKILLDARKKYSRLFEKQYIQVLQKLDVLAFVFLCYILCQEKEEIELPLLEKYAFQVQQYSNAVRQLAENIVYHSKDGCGVIAVRLHEKKSSYISCKYKVEDTASRYLEIIVSDFCRENLNGNISDNFISNLVDENAKKAFNGLQPKSFFGHDSDDTFKNAWNAFYRNPENIGKHFGLRIFQSVVSTFGGMFGAESHCGYINMPGDSFLSYQGSETQICMPGTRYHIVLPIENVKKVIRRQDLSLDSGFNIVGRVNDYLSYTIDEITFSDEIVIYQSQEQKNEQIQKLADRMKMQLENANKDIIYVSLGDVEDNSGEIIAKALTIALYQFKKDVSIVLYQCSDSVKKGIYDTMRIFYINADIEGMFFDKRTQVILYSKNFEEIVLELSSMQKTDSINAYIAHMKCISPEEGYLSEDIDSIDLNIGAAYYVPCDVLYRVTIQDKKQTLFEHYTESILKNSIQKNEFGCKLEHTHMRLGSTIHIDKFYEAEILFGNRLFVSRFALLLVKDMKEDIRDISKLTLYGYGTYSETVLVQMIEMIDCLYPEKKDIDYIVLEREEERRGFLHKDKIRYNKHFYSNEERVNYFKDRKVATIVLINSTLKTHMRLINLFREENDISAADCHWLIKNYAVILVGSANTNGYWRLEDNSVILQNGKISPTPKYFIQVDADYQEPSECTQCFPTNPVAEVPLIEVNAASTIPNQAFGIVENKYIEELKLDYKYIQEEEEKLECLKNEFAYGHVLRNENHFLYYFRTENICIKQKDNIKISLDEWRRKQKLSNSLQYNIIVSPMHFSNAGFVELVNNVVFDGNAILLRIDFDKEYRCNAYTKYSYLRNYIKQLDEAHFGGTVCVHYVDDAIISGRTFHRAKSLMQSVLSLDKKNSNSIKIKVFDKVFVLVDRNSSESRNQYVTNCKSDFYAFVTVNISSLRNYGDSCVYCNLKKEADLLFGMASTKTIADYWKHCSDKFQLYSLEEYNTENEQPDYEKQFRRLFCTHMAQCVLKEKFHGNNTVQAIYLILKLLNTDFEARKEDKYEYFLSYLKCISRPFLVFKKAIKEAIFDIMLILIDAIVRNVSLREIIKEIKTDKPYLEERKLIINFNRLNNNIIKSTELSDENKKDLVKLLMKQLTELKSNYIIRPEKMEGIFAFMKGESNESFEKYYLTLIDRLVGASSDTNKSIWLDNTTFNNRFKYVPEKFRIWILLENTRTFRDGIEKLYKRIYEENVNSKEFCETVNTRIYELEEEYDYSRAYEMAEVFAKKYAGELATYRRQSDLDSEMAHNMKNKIERFLKSLPELKTLSVVGIMNDARQTTSNLAVIFDIVHEELKEECDQIKIKLETNDTQENLLKWIEAESDMYQFGNFYKLLKEEGYYEDSKLLPNGADMISCCVKILDLCRHKELAIMEKVQLLAILFKVILNAHKVQFIIENKEDSNLDEWKYDIEKRYNDIVDKVCEMNGEGELKKICIKGKKHYSILVEKAGGEDFNTEVSDITEKLIDEMENQPSKLYNYIIDKTNGVVIWKLENNQRSVWINIENQNWCSAETGYELRIARSVRKVMMFYQELKREIFNPENDDYMNKLSHARQELNIYNSNKVYTHTKDYSKEILFEQTQRYFQNGEENAKYVQKYPSYLLKLLADINISQYYRYGLRRKYYSDDRGIDSAAKWSDFAVLIKDGQEFSYCINRTETVNIQLKVCDINVEDDMLCRDSPSSIREITMLIYALILNAAEQNRGKRQSRENDIQSGEERVIVNIYKDNGYFVIENECESAVDLDRIKRKLHHVPDSEEDGISLWSFNCYIRQCINSLILARLKEIEHSILENRLSITEIKNVGNWINSLTSQEYEIQPEHEKKEDGRCYFRVKIPLFMEKFKEGKETNYE